MKKLIMILLIAVLLVGTMELYMLNAIEDKNKEYNQITKELILKDASTKENILTARLNTPQNYRVGAGYQKVAEFTINPYQDYSSVLGSFEFYDLNDNAKPINKQIDVKYLAIEQVSINDYKIECSDNKTGNAICSQIKTGSHLEERETWKAFNGNVKSNEPVTIGLFTDVKIGEHIEWIPTIANVKVNEWAEWTADLNVGLVAYYKFDEQDTSGTGKIVDSLGINNGTNAGGDNSSGKLGTAYDYNGASDYIDLNTKTLLGGVSAFTISTWVWHDATGSTDFIFGSWATANFVMMIRIDDTALGFYTRTSGVIGGTTQTLSTTGAWIHIVAIYNGTTMMTYVNGVESATRYTQTGTITATGTVNYTLGAGASGYWDGKIDEVGIWNRSLTDAEIVQLYNSGNGITYITGQPDNPPVVSLTSPIAYYNSTTKYMTFKGNASDDIKLMNVSFYLNGTLNQTDSSGLNNSEYTFLLTLANGYYNWSYSATDNASQTTYSTTRFFNVSHAFDVPHQIADFSNITMTFNDVYEGDLISAPYWNNMTVGTSPNYMIFSFVNPDNDQIVNLSTLYYTDELMYINAKITSKFYVVVVGITSFGNQRPFVFALRSFESNYTFKVENYGCNNVGCTKGNDFWVTIGDADILVIEPDSFIVQISDYLFKVFPDSEGLSLIEKLGITFLFVFIINLMIFVGFSQYFDTSSTLLISEVMSVLALIYFISIKYIPLGLVYLIILIIAGYAYLSSRK